MTNHGGLLVAIELATRKRDEAGQVLAQELQRQQNARHQMEQLEGYAADTQARWSLSAQSSSTPQLIGHYYQFMTRLEQTIELQRGVIGDMQRQGQLGREALLHAEVHLAGLNRLLERRRQEHTRTETRREQKQTDEYAARRFSVSVAGEALQDTP